MYLDLKIFCIAFEGYVVDITTGNIYFTIPENIDRNLGIEFTGMPNLNQYYIVEIYDYQPSIETSHGFIQISLGNKDISKMMEKTKRK